MSPQLLAARALRGPNLRSRGPVLEATLRATPEKAESIARRALAIERACGCHVDAARAEPGPGPGTHTLILDCEDETVARRALELAIRPDARAEAELRDYADGVLLGPNTRALAEAARRRGIPVRRIGNGSLLILGHGARQRRLCGARTGATSAIGESVGWEKPLAKELLRAAGVPTPDGRAVKSAEEACRAAAELGGLVVVKPGSANHGKGVFIGLSTPGEIAAAFAVASQKGDDETVLVERYIPGAEHRLLVVQGHVVAAARGDALYVTGNGRATVADLAGEVNRDPRRSKAADAPLYAVEFDAMTRATLTRQGLTPESVPAAGKRVLIQYNGNHAVDVTAAVCAENRELCALAAEVVGLDIAGVDVIAEDIARPVAEQGGAVLEVNAMPGFMMHLRPAVGEPQPVDDAIVAAAMPEGEDGRIPIVAVYEDEALAAEIARRLGAPLAKSTGELERMLLNPRLETVVAAITAAGIRAEGLAFDRCFCAVCGPGAEAPEGDLLKSVAAAILPYENAAAEVARRLAR